MADDLDRAAQHAADAAQHSRSSFYGSDRDFQRAIANFARRAHGFNVRMANYRARPWQVDDELAGLLADARSRFRNSLKMRRRSESASIARDRFTIFVPPSLNSTRKRQKPTGRCGRATSSRN